MNLIRILSFTLCLSGCARAVMAVDSTDSLELPIGMSTALTGPASDLGKDVREGVLAAFERANRSGGIHGRRLHLIALDDGYEPVRTAPNMRQLLEKDKVIAVIGNVGTPTAIAAIPIADEQKTLFYAPFTGAGILHKNPPDRYVINFRPSYDEETAAMVTALIERAGLKPEEIVAFTQCDSYGDAGFNGIIAALKSHGLTDERKVLHVRYERNTLAVENALASVLYARVEPRAIVMVGAYAPCAKFIRLAHDIGLKPVFLNVSFVGSNALAAALGKVPARVIVTQVVPNPLDTRIAIVGKYQLDLKASNSRAVPSFGSLEGYLAASVLVTALDRIPGPPTREKVIDALEGLGKFEIGFGPQVELTPNDHDICHAVWPTIFHENAFVPFNWSDISDLTKAEITR
jgi:ABC-type branched-subunit amino acid transport system substrate-binding protein